MESVNWRLVRTLMICGSLIIAVSLGVRHTFGLFLQPVSVENGWGREVFAFAVAVQNLVWGVTQPISGMLADRYGTGRIVIAGVVFYALGLVMMALPLGSFAFVMSAGVLIGLGLSGTSFSIVFGAIGRAIPPERRSFAFGLALSIGSFGQFVMLPATLGLIDGWGWGTALIALSILTALMLPLAFPLMERGGGGAAITGASALSDFRSALGHNGFRFLSFGFFVCGFQVVLVGIHLPAFLADQGLPVSVASTVLALIGLFNIFGTLAAGWLGGRFSKPMLLVFIYLARAVAIALFVTLPITSFSAYVFGVAMGLLWLSTVPLTNGTVAVIFGVKNMAMLGGLVFLSHQIGAFLGGWLGGAIYDSFGSYDIAWGIAIALSIVAAAANIPVRERPLAQGLAAGKA